MGGPDVACQFFKMAMLHVSYFPSCSMSNLINSHVSCHYLFSPPCRMSLSLMSSVEVKKIPCRCVEFRVLGPLDRPPMQWGGGEGEGGRLSAA